MGNATMTDKTPHPVSINLHSKSRLLLLEFDDGSNFELSCEFLRVYSPSAEVKGHGPGQQVLLTGKEDVNIAEIEPVGHYAIKLKFDDGHDTGIYSWEYLYDLGKNYERYCQDYSQALKQAGHERKLQ